MLARRATARQSWRTTARDRDPRADDTELRGGLTPGGPARALGVADEGHLRPGARADLAMLNVDLGTLLAADERLAEVRAEVTVMDGIEVPTA